jgi:kumamolisin
MPQLTGSTRTLLGEKIGPAHPDERFQVSVIIRGRSRDDFKKDHLAKLGDQSRVHISREDFGTDYGAAPADIKKVKAFAKGNNLAVVEVHAARRTVVLSGTVAQFETAFSIKLRHFRHDAGSHRGHKKPVMLPDDLDDVVQAVLGLDNRPQALPHFRTRPGNALVPSAAQPSFSPLDLARLYNFPAGTGLGQCIAIIELGGGYRPADLRKYFNRLKIAPLPKVSAVSVDGGMNHPTGDVRGPDGEVMLDIEIAGAIAPKAEIVVYFAPNTDAGFIDAVTTAIHDTINKPSVISISWGAPESKWSRQAMTAMDEAFQAAAAMGITVCVASGDNGSSDGVPDGKNHVDFPASSPYVLGCGGTKVLQAADRTIQSETVWSGSGGGESAVFRVPDWQKEEHVTKAQGPKPEPALKWRGVPDVAGDADPATGYNVRVDGIDMVFGGTSAVAPLWAGLIALMNSSRGSPLGYFNPWLYTNAKVTKVLTDIKVGNNGDFSASPGWDACTGLGTPAAFV